MKSCIKIYSHYSMVISYLMILFLSKLATCFCRTTISHRHCANLASTKHFTSTNIPMTIWPLRLLPGHSLVMWFHLAHGLSAWSGEQLHQSLTQKIRLYIYIYISIRSITPRNIKYDSKSLDVVQYLYIGSKLPSSGTYK